MRLLAYLGITLPAFTIAGGILLFLIAIDMLFARPTGAKQTAEETRAASEAENPAVFPLAVPMIAGPGTIATVLLLGGLTHGDKIRILVVTLAYATRARRDMALHDRRAVPPAPDRQDRNPRRSRGCSASSSPRWRCSSYSTVWPGPRSSTSAEPPAKGVRGRPRSDV